MSSEEVKQEATESDAEVKIEAEPVQVSMVELYALHGGDPRGLDLGRCLLVSKIPSSMLEDKYELFRDSMYSLLQGDFNVPKEALDAVIRAPRLFSDTEENGLRAIISFKSRVHKHRVFAQKDGEASLSVAQVDELPRDFVDDGDDFVMADEVVGDEEEDEAAADSENKAGNQSIEPNGEDLEEVDYKQDDEEDEEKADGEGVEKSEAADDKDANGDAGKKKFKKRDEEEEEPFEISWDGAPEFQWKLCQSPADCKQLVMENITLGDLHDPWIYRVLARAKTVDIHIPWRVEAGKDSKGRIVLTFMEENAIMSQALRYLIFVRSPLGRRIKIYLPQTPQAVSRKAVFEARLGRIVKHRKPMYQLVIKELPKDVVLDVNKTQPFFPDQAINEVEHKDDANGNPCLIVTFASAEDSVMAHLLHQVIEVDGTKCHVYLMENEVDPEKLLTRSERRELVLKEKREREKERLENKEKILKRKAETNGDASKRPRIAPSATSRPVISRGTSGRPVSTRGGYTPRGRPIASARPIQRPAVPPFRGWKVNSSQGFLGGIRPFSTPRGGFVSNRGRGTFPDRREPFDRRPAPFDRRAVDLDEKIREQRSAIALQEQLLRQQQIIDSLAARVSRDRDPLPSVGSSGGGGGYSDFRDTSASYGRHSYGGSSSYDRPSGYSAAPSYHGPSAFAPSDSTYLHRGGSSGASSWAPLRR